MVEMPLRGATADNPPECEENGDDHCQVTTKMTTGIDVIEQDIERCGCCPKKCYANNCVMINSVVTCFIMVVSVGVLVGLTITLARPHLGALMYVNGTCKTVTSNYTGVRERCACDGRFCAADYPCLDITVEYKTRDGSIIESMLHEEEHVFTYRSHCSFQPDACTDGQNDFTVDLYKHRWGVSGKTFPCFHNPSGPGALRRRTRSISFILLIILLPAACSIISTVLCCVVYCYCCPRSRVHRFGQKGE